MVRYQFGWLWRESQTCVLRERFEIGFRIWASGCFVQSDDRADDGYTSLKERAESCEALKNEIAKKKKADRDFCAEIACKEWIDVRAFGQVFAFKGTSVSFGVRGPVSIHQAVSLSPVDVVSMQITKSVNSEAGKESKASDTMGTKHFIPFAVYKIMGSVNVQLAERPVLRGGRCAKSLKKPWKHYLKTMRPLQDRREVWKYAKCTGGSMMRRHRQLPAERFREASHMKHVADQGF